MSFHVLPPGPGKCRSCAVEHSENLPHDATSLYYQILFVNAYGRSPTWRDAMMHCDQETQERWIKFLTSKGFDVDSTNTRGGIKTQKDLDERLGKSN